MTQQTGQHDCAACGIKTTKCCAGCLEGLDSEGKLAQTNYCGKVCQKADWQTHESTCKEKRLRKQLYRTGALIQQVLYLHRELAFDLKIKRTEKAGEKVKVVEADYGMHEFLFSFPAGLFNTEEDKKAMLTWNACTDGISHMYMLIKNTLGVICSSISEVSLQVRAPNRIALFKNETIQDTNNYQHELIKLELKDGTSYALDLTGAQYGQMEAVMPWKRYVDTSVSCIIATHDFGYFKKFNEDMLSGVHDHMVVMTGGYNDMRPLMAQKEITKALDAAVDNWEKANKKTVANMLKAKDVEYQADMKKLLAHVRSEVRKFMSLAAKNGGIVRYKLAPAST